MESKMTTPVQYRDITDRIQAQMTEFIDARNLLNLFPNQTTDSNTIVKLIFRHLNDVAEASLSEKLWDPAKTKIESEIYAQKRFSSGIRQDLEYEDWIVLQKMDNVLNRGMDKIAMKPLKQGTHYFFTGKKLVEAPSTRGNSPLTTQYNFVRDAGTSNGTLARPLIISNATTGVWSTFANFSTDVNKLINGLVEVGFEDKSNFLIFYPTTLESDVSKNRTTSGDGRYNLFAEAESHGIPRDQVIGIPQIYLPEIATDATPVSAKWDLYCVDRSMVEIFYTEAPFINVYIDGSGDAYPKMTIQANMAYCPVFKPLENRVDGKIYKGVSRITAINSA